MLDFLNRGIRKKRIFFLCWFQLIKASLLYGKSSMEKVVMQKKLYKQTCKKVKKSLIVLDHLFLFGNVIFFVTFWKRGNKPTKGMFL